MKIELRASKSGQWKDLTVEERRERRRLRREKQRENNRGRAAKMHLSRLKTKKEDQAGVNQLARRCLEAVEGGTAHGQGARCLLAPVEGYRRIAPFHAVRSR